MAKEPISSKALSDMLATETPEETKEQQHFRIAKAIKESAEQADRDEDGFIELEPTELGKKVLSQYGMVSSTLELEDHIRKKLNEIEAGDWDKARIGKSTISTIESFINTMGQIPPDMVEDDQFQLMTLILEYAKSFYEYASDDSPISDAYYDKLLAYYKSLGAVEPTGVVPVNQSSEDKETPTSSAVSIKNPNLHNNLDKCYRIMETDEVPEGTAEKTSVESWLAHCYDALARPKSASTNLMLAHKLDGVSVIMDIDSTGTITAAQSRGDEDKAMAMPGLVGMRLLPDDRSMAFRPFQLQVEMFCSHEARNKIPEIVGVNKEYKSNRSAISGLRKRLESGYIVGCEDVISFYPINAENVYDESGPVTNYQELMDFIQNFSKVPDGMRYPTYISGNFDDLLRQISEYFEHLTQDRETLPYPIDGMVITLADRDDQLIVGRSGRTNQFQIAMKFDPAHDDARAVGVTLSAGNKGFRTPMVQLDHPVFIDGAEYTEVQVLSARQYDELELDENCLVRIHRTGDVIPKLTKIGPGNGKPLKLPGICPCCGHPLIRQNQKLKCTNPDCEENMAGRIRTFFKTLDIEGYSDAFARRLVDAGYKTPVALFNITADELKKLGITGKLAEAFPDQLKEKLATSRDYVLIAALGLQDIASETARKILRAVPLKKLVDMSYAEMVAQIKALPGFDTKSEAIAKTLFDAIPELKTILDHINPIYMTKVGAKPVTVGHTGVAPGILVKFWVDKLGYDITDGGNFDLLLVGDPETKSRKAEKARKRNIKILTEDDMVSELKSRYYKLQCTSVASFSNAILKPKVIPLPAAVEN